MSADFLEGARRNSVRIFNAEKAIQKNKYGNYYVLILYLIRKNIFLFSGRNVHKQKVSDNDNNAFFM
jgi:hypothetical protein